MSKPPFPRFWFDGNAFFGWIIGPGSLARLEAAYPDGAWRDARRCDHSTDRDNFGFRIEHAGVELLGDWFDARLEAPHA